MEKAKTTFQGIYGMMWEKPALMVKDMDHEKTALIIIDMVNGIVRGDNRKNADAEDLVEPVADLMKYFKEHNMPVVCFGDSHSSESQKSEASSDAALLDELKAVGGYTYIAKNSTNAFLEPEFGKWLEANPDITDFVVAGVFTDISIMQFCLTLKADFNRRKIKSEVVLPLNAVDSYDLAGHNITLTNTMSVYFMEQMGIKVFYEINLTNKRPIEICHR